MKPTPARTLRSVQWLPAERLGQMSIDASLRHWLIGNGLLSARLKDISGDGYFVRMVDQWTGLLSGSHKLGLRSNDSAGLFRDVELGHHDQVWVFAQTVAPDSTLSLHPWLAELGDSALDAILEGLSGIERSPFEYAWLPSDDNLTAHALREADVKPLGLWARRSRIALRGAPLLLQEAFLPTVGHAQRHWLNAGHLPGHRPRAVAGSPDPAACTRADAKD